MKAEWIFIDGRHLLFRTADVFSDLSAEVGGEVIGTGGIYGFLAGCLRVHAKYGGRIVVAWEGRQNFRRDLYPLYKQRGEMSDDARRRVEDVWRQEQFVQALMRVAGLEQFSGVRCEADDVLGTLAATRRGVKIIYSGDSDLRQLVEGETYVVAPGRQGDVLYDASTVFKRHGVPPHRIADLKALAGDTSDNIPGARSIGEVTAVKLLTALGDVEDVIRSARTGEDWPGSARQRMFVADAADDVRLFKRLTTIKRDAGLMPIKPRRDRETLKRHLIALEFSSYSSASELMRILSMGVAA